MLEASYFTLKLIRILEFIKKTIYYFFNIIYNKYLLIIYCKINNLQDNIFINLGKTNLEKNKIEIPIIKKAKVTSFIKKNGTC
jgi:hypothetical protein